MDLHRCRINMSDWINDTGGTQPHRESSIQFVRATNTHLDITPSITQSHRSRLRIYIGESVIDVGEGLDGKILRKVFSTVDTVQESESRSDLFSVRRVQSKTSQSVFNSPPIREIPHNPLPLDSTLHSSPARSSRIIYRRRSSLIHLLWLLSLIPMMSKTR